MTQLLVDNAQWDLLLASLRIGYSFYVVRNIAASLDLLRYRDDIGSRSLSNLLRVPTNQRIIWRCGCIISITITAGAYSRYTRLQKSVPFSTHLTMPATTGVASCLLQNRG
jgi:hypothetical protein